MIRIFSLVESVHPEGGQPMVPAIFSQVLEEYEQVFHMLDGLSPIQEKSYQIILKEGTNPISVRPYRYPPFQNDETKRLVGDMLRASVIKPSISSFSSHVLLVKKKDGSCRFCVDYQALNRKTIPDKYHIPVTDELLDELH